MSLIELRDVTSKEIAKESLLKDIILTCERGEFMMLSGPLNSGRGTLLRMIAGVNEPLKGKCMVFNTDIYALNIYERERMRIHEMALYLSHEELIDTLTVYENLKLSLSFHKIPSKMQKERILDSLIQFGMESMLHKKVGDLTKTEKQLISLARVISLQRRLILLEEPTLYLDHVSSVKVMTFLRQLAVDHQVTVMISVADVRLYPFAHRVIKMQKGSIEKILGEFIEDSALPFLEL